MPSPSNPNTDMRKNHILAVSLTEKWTEFKQTPCHLQHSKYCCWHLADCLVIQNHMKCPGKIINHHKFELHALENWYWYILHNFIPLGALGMLYRARTASSTSLICLVSDTTRVMRVLLDFEFQEVLDLHVDFFDHTYTLWRLEAPWWINAKMDGTTAEKKLKEQTNGGMKVLDSSWLWLKWTMNGIMVVSSSERSCEIMEEFFLTARAETNKWSIIFNADQTPPKVMPGYGMRIAYWKQGNPINGR